MVLLVGVSYLAYYRSYFVIVSKALVNLQISFKGFLIY